MTANGSPLVSVIMPIRNEAAFIERSLRSVLSQDYPASRLEILMVDGMSKDGTAEIVRHLIDAQESSGLPSPQRIVFLQNPKRIVPAALNAALNEARGEIIVRVDGHCEIAPTYISRCVEVSKDTGADCVGGPLVTVGEGRVSRAIARAQSSWFGVGGAAFRTGRTEGGYVDTLAFGAYRRSVFELIGPFDPELVRNQDDEFNFRLTQAGGKIWMDPSIRSLYYSRADLRGLWRQYFQYGFYKVRLIQKRAGVPSWRQLVPAAFVTGILLSQGLALLTGEKAWALSVVGPYMITVMLASLWSAAREWEALPFLPLVFPTMHVSYGVGFLWGIWKWKGEWFRPSRVAVRVRARSRRNSRAPSESPASGPSRRE